MRSRLKGLMSLHKCILKLLLVRANHITLGNMLGKTLEFPSRPNVGDMLMFNGSTLEWRPAPPIGDTVVGMVTNIQINRNLTHFTEMSGGTLALNPTLDINIHLKGVEH